MSYYSQNREDAYGASIFFTETLDVIDGTEILDKLYKGKPHENPMCMYIFHFSRISNTNENDININNNSTTVEEN